MRLNDQAMKGGIMLNRKIVTVSLLIGMCCSGIALCDDQADLFKQPSAFVESYVVQISTDALTEAGINTIGQTPEKMSVTKVIWALLTNPEESVVLSGGKSSVLNGSGCMVRGFHTKCFGDEFFETGMSLEIDSVAIQDQSALMTYEYNLEEAYPIDRKDMAKKRFPDKNGYRWAGSIVLKSGKPVIAAATQNEDTVTFLIFNATIQQPKN